MNRKATKRRSAGAANKRGKASSTSGRRREAKTLSELTFRLSEDIEALDRECESEQTEIDRRREEELASFPKAVDILRKYHQALAKARKTLVQSRLKAERARDKTVRAAEDKRRRNLSKQETSYRRSRDGAYRKKREAQKKARDRWQRELKRIRTRPLEDQRRLRRVADERYDEELRKASDAFNASLDKARIEHRSALQDALIEERLAVDQANRQAEKRLTGAAIDYERAQASQEATLRAGLHRIPDASTIQVEHDARMAQSRESCERRKDSLFREFSRNRRKLSA